MTRGSLRARLAIAVEGASRDARYAVRSLRRRPVVVAGVLSVLTVGLGANAVVAALTFAFLGAAPPGLRDPASIRRLHVRAVMTGGHGAGMFSRAEIEAIRRGAIRDGNLVGYMVRDVLLESEGGVHTARVGFYVGDLRGLLSGIPEGDGPRPVLVPASMRRANQHDIRVGGRRFPIDGALPPSFTGFDLSAVEFWLPFPEAKATSPENDRSLRAVVRLAGGVSEQEYRASAERALNDWARNAGATGSMRGPLTVTTSTLVRADTGESPGLRTLTGALVAAGLLILVVAVLNASQLLLTRAAERFPELAVRAALGASPGNLVRSLAAEAVMLCVAAGVLAFSLITVLSGRVQSWIDLGAPIGTAGRTAAVVIGLALTALCALVISAILSRGLGTRLSDYLRSGAGVSPAQGRWQRLSLATQATLASVVVMLAWLLVGVAQHATRADFGLDVEGTLVVRASLRDDDPAVARDAYRRMAAIIGKIPGVMGASVSSGIPLRSSVATYLALPGRDRPPTLVTGGPYVTEVDPTFLRATGARLIRGRFFDRPEDRGATIVVNETAAHLYWPGADAIGQCAYVGSSPGCARVIGIMANVRRESLIEGPTVQIYRLSAEGSPFVSRAVLVRGAVGPRQLSAAIQSGLAANAPDIKAQVSMLNEMTERERQVWTLLGSFASVTALIGVLTAAAGIFSMAAYSAFARKREFAIRLALGATPARVITAATSRTIALIALGMGVGALGIALIAPRAVPRSADAAILNWPQSVAALAVVLLISVCAATYPAAITTKADLRRSLME